MHQCRDAGFVRPGAGPLAPAALLGFLLGSAVGCGQAGAPPEAPLPKVTVQHPEERELVRYDTYNGWTRASAMVEVRARVRGHIKDVPFTDGEFVKKGDLLFELDPRPFQADIDRAKDQLAIDEAQMEFAVADAERNQALYDKKTISKAELEKAIATRKTWEAKVQASRQQIELHKLDLEYSRITADIPGRVGRAQLTRGNLVNAGGSDPLLTTIVAIDPIHVYFAVDERSLLKYRQGHGRKIREEDSAASKGSPPPESAANAAPPEANDGPAVAEPAEPADDAPSRSRANPVKDAKIPFEFGFETEKGYPHQGVIDFADNRIDPETGTIEVRGTASNADGEFIPGSRVRVRVPVSDTFRAIVVPDLAILSDQDQRYVLVVTEDKVVVRRTITPGLLLDDGMRVIEPAKEGQEGLSPGDWVIVLGLQRARVNDPVDPVDADGKAVDVSQKRRQANRGAARS